MSNPNIRKAAKLLVLLLIISVTTYPLYSYGQTDTAKLRKELNSLLRKYGLKDATFLLKVESLNQKGGQTAFEINNYNGRDNHVVNGTNYGINGNVNINSEKVLNNIEFKQLIDYVEKIKRDNRSTTNCIELYNSNFTKSKFLGSQLRKLFTDNGYSVLPNYGYKDFGIEPYSGFDVTYRSKNNCIEVSIMAL